MPQKDILILYKKKKHIKVDRVFESKLSQNQKTRIAEGKGENSWHKIWAIHVMIV